MQAALCFAQPLPIPQLTPAKTSATRLRSLPRLQTTLVSRCTPINANAGTVDTVDYSSTSSVFPAEACETIGGEACDVEMNPEVKLKVEDKSTGNRIASESVDREYFEYNDLKTVFPGEACDDLGGEFCSPEYQKGVY